MGTEVVSPFIAGTQIQYAWDATSIDAGKKCPRYYQYTIIDNWQAKQANIHLRWGLEFHSALEDYEHFKADGSKHDDALHYTLLALFERIQGWEPQAKEGVRSEELKTKENLVKTVVWYLDHYEYDAAKTVILENGKPAVELSFAFELGFDPDAGRKTHWKANSIGIPEEIESDSQKYMLCGHLDKIVRFSGDLYVMDHKTTTSTPSGSYFAMWDPNNQMTVYTIASQTIMNSPIKGVIVDAIQVASTFSRPVRGITYRSSARLDEWLKDLQIWLRTFERYAEEGYWPQNDTACTMYGGCRFREVCSKSPQVRDAYLKSKFTQDQERWNPLKAR